MILQALVKRYEDAGGEKQGWRQREADFALNIDYQGNIINIIPLEEEIEVATKKGGSSKKKVRKKLSLPATETRTVGIVPFFLSDKAGYIAGIDPKKYQAAANLHCEVLSKANGVTAKSIISYFEKIPTLPADFQIPDTKNDCVFMVNGRYAHEDIEIMTCWDNYYNAKTAGNERIRDLITGEEDILWRKQEGISLRGVTMGKQALVSINAESFSSYGQASSATDDKKKTAAQLGKKSSVAYATALNDLLTSKNHHKMLSGDTLVYWAEGQDGGEQEAEVFSWFNDPQESDDVKINSVMQSLASGSSTSLYNCDFSKPFYMLCLSPNAGRISIRYFHVDSFGTILKNNALHYEQMQIVSSSRDEKYPFIPPWIILSETTVTKKTSDAAPLLGGQLLDAIISAKKYPMTLYLSILTRIRANEDINKTKAAIIKAVLIRNFNEKEVTTMALNAQTNNIPYNLGRLFAVLEMLQKKAIGTANIREKYFATACANPSVIFPTILRLSMHHAAKLDNAVFYEALKTEILGKLDVEDPFPKAFSISDQGRFVLGYYHQMQSFYTKKEKMEEENNV